MMPKLILLLFFHRASQKAGRLAGGLQPAGVGGGSSNSNGCHKCAWWPLTPCLLLPAQSKSVR